LANAGAAQNFVTPDIVTELSQNVKETSGLVNLSGEIWTHNDHGDDPLLYRINTTDGSIIRTVEVINASNEDWEDITSDEYFLYIGDIGNNYGDRTDLCIYKVNRDALASNDEVYAEVINYSYSDQTFWEPNHNNNNFDCEALISYGNKLYLFSKNWVDHQTRCYQLPKQAGTYIAEYQSTFDIECLVTGAELVDNSNKLILIGYNLSGGSYTWVFEDYNDNDFFNSTHTKFIWTSLTQIEGICPANETGAIYISSEEFSGFIDPTLYIQMIYDNTSEIGEQYLNNFKINKYNNFLVITPEGNESITAEIHLLNTSGEVLYRKHVKNKSQVQIPAHQSRGIYLLIISNNNGIITYKILP
jgi:hypothetical protein